MPSNHLILCRPLLLLPSIFPSIRVFSNESGLHINWTKIGASASVLPMNIQDRFPLGLTALIFLLSKRLSRVFPKEKGVFSSTTIWKHQFFSTQPSLWSNSHIHTWLLEKTIPLTIVGKAVSLLFNIFARFVIAFTPRNKHLLISWLQSPSAVILETKKIKSLSILL